MTGPLTFAEFRARGIAEAQRVSGDLWTDFNTHDPGVTLLEAYCYALTELGYRAEFDVADLLADEDGTVPLARLGLHAPADALPTRPVTAADLAAALVSQTQDAQQVLVYPGQKTSMHDRRGLWDLYVIEAYGAALDRSDKDILAQVREAYYGQRNLCEDIGLLQHAEPIECRLVADVEVRRRCNPDAVAGMIHDRCYRLLIDRVLSETVPPVTRADVFERPGLMFGAARQAEDDPLPGHAPGAESLDPFFLAVSGIDGVEDVTSLRIETVPPSGPGFDPFAIPLRQGQFRRLVFPTKMSDSGLRLFSRGLQIPYEISGMTRTLMRLRSEDRARRRIRRETAEWPAAIPGTPRSYRHERIGNDLPVAYGVGKDLPAGGMSQEDRRGARQLRAYLGFSDATLVNATADLAALPELFSVDLKSPRSYQLGLLDPGEDPFILRDLPGSEAGSGSSVDSPLRGPPVDLTLELDPWRDRKGRVLNYLLALYGEAFTQNSLQTYDLYRTGAARADAILKNRVQMLTEVADLGRDRSAGADMSAGPHGGQGPYGDGIGLGRKLAILLDLPERTRLPRHLLDTQPPLANRGIPLSPETPSDAAFAEIGLDPPKDPFSTLVPIQDTTGLDRTQLDRMIRSLLDERQQLNPWIFRRAAVSEAFVLGQEAGRPLTVYLTAPEDAASAPVPSEYGDQVTASGEPKLFRLDGLEQTGTGNAAEARSDAIRLANALREEFASLNREAEGLYLVEDILLRPTPAEPSGQPAATTQERDAGGVQRPDFDPLFLYIVFAGWSARCHTPGFRALAEETATLICPAHLGHAVLWLDEAEMAHFEALHRTWWTAFTRWAKARGHDPALDTAAADLRAFLAERLQP